MAEEHDSWLESALGVSVDDLREAKDAVSEAVAPVVESVETKVEGAVEEVKSTVAPVVQAVETKVEGAVEEVKSTVTSVVEAVEAKVEGAAQSADPAVTAKSGTPAAKDGDPNLLGNLMANIDPQGTLEFPVEFKGPKTTGIVKVNKGYFKASVKISVSGAPEGDVNIGPTAGRKSSDGEGSGQIGVTAEAKKTAQTELTKKFDAMVNSLVKSVTDKDGALKTELFAKAKAEAKGGSKEATVKIGYDFGIDATVFGMGKGTFAVKFTLAGLKYKPSEKIPISATVLSADVSQKVAIKWKEAFQLRQTHYDIEGSVEMGAEFEPNWAEIAKDAVGDVAEAGASAAIMTAIDAAVVAGLPLLASVIVGQAIYMAGEKGALDAAILEGALDARQAAFAYANTMVGAEGVDTGPRAKAAIAQAKKDLAQVASSQQVSVDEIMSELRKMAPHPDFGRIHAQARQQIFSAYYGGVGKVIKAWRKEHYVLAVWTTEEDDIISVNKKVAIVFER